MLIYLLANGFSYRNCSLVFLVQKLRNKFSGIIRRMRMKKHMSLPILLALYNIIEMWLHYQCRFAFDVLDLFLLWKSRVSEVSLQMGNRGWGLKRWVNWPSRWSNFLLPVSIVLSFGDFKTLPKIQWFQTSEQCRQRCALLLASHHACQFLLKVIISGKKPP